MTRLPVILAAIMALAMTALLVLPLSRAHAQAPVQSVSAGSITGTVTMATAGEAVDPALLTVEVIILAEGGVTGTKAATIEGDSYEVRVDADEALTYVPRATYDGVAYFSGAIMLDDDTTTAARDFTIYATTDQVPALEVQATTVTMVAIDRGARELGFVREDIVVNPSDRVYIGSGPAGGERITLRLPAPERTQDAAGENADGRFTFEGGVVTTTTPLRPGETAVITRYLTTYDAAEDAYTLRVTAPVSTARTVLRVPAHYARALDPQGAASEGEPQMLEIADGDPVRFLIAEATNLGPGDGLVVTLDGFAPAMNSNVLTDTPQAVFATLAVLVVIGGAATYALTRPRGDHPAEVA